MNPKIQKAVGAIPGMATLILNDAVTYVTRLYLRESWKKRGLSMAATARIGYEHRGQITVGERCWLGEYSILLAASAKDSNPGPLLVLGQNIYIGDQNNIRAAGGVIRIGNDVLIGNHVTMVASNHGTAPGSPMIDQNWARGDILIEDDVWIGAGVVILPGATIRHGAVIAAGAVVRGEVPSNQIYGGVPARPISQRDKTR